LVDWTPERADTLITLLYNYSETLDWFAQADTCGSYGCSFEYAALAEEEAMLRFPSARQASLWRWNNAYNKVRGFNTEIDQIYGSLVVDGLNRGETALPGLQAWFETQEPRLDLEITDLKPLPGYPSSQILFLQPGESTMGLGGVYLWLVSGPTGFSIFPIREHQYIEPGHDAEYSLDLVDLTGDGIPEAVTQYKSRSAGINDNEVDVFDLSRVPPRKLTFEPNLDASALQLVPGWETEGGRIEFKWISPYSPWLTQAEYRWNGKVMEQTRFESALLDWFTTRGVYTDTLTYYSLLHVESGDFSDIEELKTSIDSYPLSAYEFYNDEPFPPDARDELRFRLGLAYAFHGNANEAIQQMQTIVDAPVVLTSTWITPARQFLDIYHQPEDLLAACLTLKYGDNSSWLPDLLSILPSSSPISPVDILRADGENIIASGSMDFNQDGAPEYWAINSREYHSSFIILYTVQNRYESERIAFDTPSTEITTVRFTALPSLGGMRVYCLDADGLSLLFTFYRSSDDSVQTQTMDNVITPILDDSEVALLAGTDAKSIQTQLSALQPEDYFELCDWHSHRWNCLRDRYLYLYGLAQELAGDRDEAAATYLQLWQTYPYSPYAIMAQAKLEAIP
jgi:hypothetical protein